MFKVHKVSRVPKVLQEQLLIFLDQLQQLETSPHVEQDKLEMHILSRQMVIYMFVMDHLMLMLDILLDLRVHKDLKVSEDLKVPKDIKVFKVPKVSEDLKVHKV